MLPKILAKELASNNASKMLTLQNCKHFEKPKVRLACCISSSVYIYYHEIEILICLSEMMILRNSEMCILSFQKTKPENLYIKDLAVDIFK